MRIVLATKNAGKIKEIKTILSRPGTKLLTDRDFADWPGIEESGATFYENASLKARTTASFFELPALADDSGLEVEALGGRPGVRSARYAGSGADDKANVAKLLSEMKAVKRREARFVAVTVLAWPDGRTVSATGICRGTISEVPRGDGGFGYDPVFVPAGFSRTMAELSQEEKNRISHRGQSLRALAAKVGMRSSSGAGPAKGVSGP